MIHNDVLKMLGMLFLVLALIFEIVSASDYFTKNELSNAPKDPTTLALKFENVFRYHNLALVFVLMGGALLVAGNR